MNDPREILLEIQHQLEELRPQLMFVANAIGNGDEDAEIATGAAFLLYGIADRLKAMRDDAARIFQEAPAT